MRLDLPEELDRILRKMLAKERRDRYATSQDLAVDLRKLRRFVRGYATGDDVPAKPFVRHTDSDDLTPSLSPRPPGRRKTLVAAALAVVAAFCLYWSWGWLGDRWYDWTQDLPEQKVLAVLPFQVSGGDNADRAFLLGIQKSAQVALRRLSLEYDFEVVGENLVASALRIPRGPFFSETQRDYTRREGVFLPELPDRGKPGGVPLPARQYNGALGLRLPGLIRLPTRTRDR